MTPARHIQAFTLIELMLAMTICAIILGAICTVFFSALHLRERTAEMTAPLLPVDRAVSIMKRDIAGIMPATPLPTNAVTSGASTAGTPGMPMIGLMGTDAPAIGMQQQPLVEIYTSSGTLSDSAPWGDMQKIDYSLQIPTNRVAYAGRDLMRGVTRNLLATTQTAPDQQLLLHNVDNLTFSYYDGTNWNDAWSTMLSNIPVAIRVTIEFAKSKSGRSVNYPVQFLVPVVSWASNTNNSSTNLSAN